MQDDKKAPNWLTRLARVRMADWVIAAALLTMVVWLIAPQQVPVTVYKLSLAALAAVAGYWIDRSLFPYARPAYLLDLQDALVAGSPPLVCDDDDQCALVESARDDLLLR